MSTFIHFIDIGQGNMTLLRLPNGEVLLYDCNVTNDNEDEVIRYLRRYLPLGSPIRTFINSHRDADHMRGVMKIHKRFPIKHVWDSGVTGGSPNSVEYLEYMSLRRQAGFTEVKSRTYYDKGNVRLRVMNSKNDDLADNPNAQSIVIKVVHRHPTTGTAKSRVMLTGDTDAATWKHIQKDYDRSAFSSDLLLGSHHGSLTFFDDPADHYYYTDHLEAISPAMTILSVGAANPHGHPHNKAIEFYEQYSRGSNKGNKIKRTDKHGSLLVELKDDGGWTITHD